MSKKKNQNFTYPSGLSEEKQALVRIENHARSATDIAAECERDLADSNASSHNLEFFNQFKGKEK